jgi:single-strand DNA-binding protein
MFKAEIIGNLGADVEIREFNGVKFISFSLAISESYKNKDGERVSKTTWVNCTKRGESGVLKYLTKGVKVFVRGRQTVSTYDKDGVTYPSIRINVDELTLLGGEKKNGNETNEYPPLTTQELPPIVPPIEEAINENDLPY